MKRTLTMSLALCLLLAGVSLFAAAPAAFGGTWALDKKKSDELRGPMAGADVTLPVVQDAKQLSVETKYSGGGQGVPAQKLTYSLDGTETTAEFTGCMPGKGKLSAKWLSDGKALELNSVRNVNFQGEERSITITEKWALADGGQTLTVNRTVDFGQGTLESKLVFAKK